MSYVPAQNVTGGPLVVDVDGRILGGGEWGAIDRHDPVAQEAVGDSRLAIHPDLDENGDIDEAASAAASDARKLEARRLEYANLDADRLAVLAENLGVTLPEGRDLDADELPALRRKLVRVSAAPVPKAVAEDLPDASGPPDDATSETPAIPPAQAKAPAAKRTGGSPR